MYNSTNFRKKIGWSCWGFLGNGITDTPDGGRCHRYPLLKQLIRKECSIIMLQKNRDLYEAGEDFESEYLTFSEGYPEIDVLFLEYRWPIPNRNVGISEDDIRYTPDYQRQNNLIEYYSKKNIPILIWDKDQKLSNDNVIMKNERVIVFEPCIFPKANKRSLLFPLGHELVKQFKSKSEVYAKEDRIIGLVYIGNQYERDDSFDQYINAPLGMLKIKNYIYGNWTKYEEKYRENLEKFKNVTFMGRIGFDKVYEIYNQSFATVLIAPERYYERGQFTQRLFEAMSQLCIPLAPGRYKGIDQVIIKEFIVEDTYDVVRKLRYLGGLGNYEIIELLNRQFEKLACFDIERQSQVIIESF